MGEGSFDDLVIGSDPSFWLRIDKPLQYTGCSLFRQTGGGLPRNRAPHNRANSYFQARGDGLPPPWRDVFQPFELIFRIGKQVKAHRKTGVSRILGRSPESRRGSRGFKPVKCVLLRLKPRLRANYLKFRTHPKGGAKNIPVSTASLLPLFNNAIISAVEEEIL